MRRRMIWLYTMGNDFWGTCKKWAQELETEGNVVKRTKTLWVGNPPICSSCRAGVH